MLTLDNSNNTFSLKARADLLGAANTISYKLGDISDNCLGCRIFQASMAMGFGLQAHHHQMMDT